MRELELYRLAELEIQGNLEAEDRLALEAWMAESEANKIEFEEIKAAIEGIDILLAQVDPQTDAEWSKVLSGGSSVKVDAPVVVESAQSEGRTMTLPRRRLWTKWAAAAAIALICVLSYFWFANKGEAAGKELHYAAAMGKIEHIDLPDGSKVELNGGSSLHAAADFGKSARHLQLEGEAFFEVAKDKERPFVVAIGSTTSEALGTQFNLRHAHSSKVVQLSVVEGKVRFTDTLSHQALELVAGQVAEFDPISGRLSQVQRSATDQAAWRQNLLVFEDESFPVAAELFERHYGVKFSFPERLNTARLTAKFEGRALSQVLEVIESIYNVKATQNADAVTLTDM